MSERAASRTRAFWINLGVLCLLAPGFTIWFQAHFRPFFTEVVLVGGSFTLWATARLVWGLFEKATKTDIDDASRRLLSQPGTTRLLLVAVVAFGVMWFFTGSLYFELADAPAGVSQVRIEVRRANGAAHQGDVTLTPESPLSGRPMFWLPAAGVPLQCRIVEPLGFEAADCSLARRRAVRIGAPRDFAKIEMHLLRFVPAPELYVALPAPEDTPAARHRLTLKIGGRELRWSDLRKGTLYTGRADETEVARLVERDDRERLERDLTTAFLADEFPEAEARSMAAKLTVPAHASRWATANVKAGDALVISIEEVPPAGSGEPRVVFGPHTVVVAAAPSQTIWLGRTQ